MCYHQNELFDLQIAIASTFHPCMCMGFGLLANKKYAGKNIEEISAMSGFANRQSFYAAFYRIVGITPSEYRKKHENI